LTHDTSSSWQFGDNFAADTFEVVGEQDLIIVVEGITPNELRGFVNTLEIVKLAGPMSADINRDGAVDIGDFDFLREHFNTHVPLGTLGDANSDGVVDLKDFYFWRRLFVLQGGDLSDLEATVVPEPGAATCVLIVTPVLMGIRIPMWCGGRGLLNMPPWNKEYKQ
jgi:hypothetical protein